MTRLERGVKYPLLTVLKAVLKKLKRQDKEKVFWYPVDKDVPEYYEHIKNPMDFQTMSDKLQQNQYRTFESFQNDVKLICDNCKFFNAPESTYYADAKALEQYAAKVFAESEPFIDPTEEKKDEERRNSKAEQSSPNELKPPVKKKRHNSSRDHREEPPSARKLSNAQTHQAQMAAAREAQLANTRKRKYIKSGMYRKAKEARNTPGGLDDFGMSLQLTNADYITLWKREKALMLATNMNANQRSQQNPMHMKHLTSGIGALDYSKYRPNLHLPFDQRFEMNLEAFAVPPNSLRARAHFNSKLEDLRKYPRAVPDWHEAQEEEAEELALLGEGSGYSPSASLLAAVRSFRRPDYKDGHPFGVHFELLQKLHAHLAQHPTLKNKSFVQAIKQWSDTAAARHAEQEAEERRLKEAAQAELNRQQQQAHALQQQLMLQFQAQKAQHKKDQQQQQQLRLQQERQQQLLAQQQAQQAAAQQQAGLTQTVQQGQSQIGDQATAEAVVAAIQAITGQSAPSGATDAMVLDQNRAGAVTAFEQQLQQIFQSLVPPENYGNFTPAQQQQLALQHLAQLQAQQRKQQEAQAAAAQQQALQQAQTQSQLQSQQAAQAQAQAAAAAALGNINGIPNATPVAIAMAMQAAAAGAAAGGAAVNAKVANADDTPQAWRTRVFQMEAAIRTIQEQYQQIMMQAKADSKNKDLYATKLQQLPILHASLTQQLSQAKARFQYVTQQQSSSSSSSSSTSASPSSADSAITANEAITVATPATAAAFTQASAASSTSSTSSSPQPAVAMNATVATSQSTQSHTNPVVSAISSAAMSEQTAQGAPSQAVSAANLTSQSAAASSNSAAANSASLAAAANSNAANANNGTVFTGGNNAATLQQQQQLALALMSQMQQGGPGLQQLQAQLQRGGQGNINMASLRALQFALQGGMAAGLQPGQVPNQMQALHQQQQLQLLLAQQMRAQQTQTNKKGEPTPDKV